MDISFNYIDLNISSFEITRTCETFIDKESSLLLIAHPKSSSVVQFDNLTFQPKTSEIIPDDDGRQILFSNCGTVYKLNTEGSLLRLLFTSPASIDHGSVFGSSGSSASEVFSWTRISENFGKVVTATGVSNGFATITKDDANYSFNVYDNLDKPSIKCSKRLQVGADGNRKLFSFKPNKLSQHFLKHIFGELFLVLTDVVVMSTPTGTVMLFPILADKNNQDFVPIYCDTDKLVHVAISPCKNSFILLYQNGRVVFIIFEEHIVVYKRLYLSTSIKTSNIISHDLMFSVVWSDGNNSYYTIPNTLKEFTFKERKAKMRGIVKIEQISNRIILLNVNCCAYVGEFCSNLSDSKYSEPNLKEEIIKLSKNIDQIKESCKITNENLAALKNEQIDVSLLKLSLENNTLSIENLSSSIFNKEKWSVFLESINDFKHFTKTQKLNNNFCQSDKIMYDVQNFVNLGCTTLRVSLISLLYENQRLLIVPVGTLNILSNVMEIA